MSGRLVNGILNDCSMSSRASGMAFDQVPPALREAMAQDERTRADMRLRTARPAFDVKVDLGDADILAQIPKLDRLP
jgi:hypothetical protein